MTPERWKAILWAVGKAFGVPPKDIFQKSIKRVYVEPRWVAITLARRAGFSNWDLAVRTNGNRRTVERAPAMCKTMSEVDRAFSRKVNLALELLEGKQKG